jgi:predicted transcriptional regulator
MSDVIERLHQKEKIIKDLQQKKDRQDGQRTQLLQQLRDEFKVETVEEALIVLESLQTGVESNDLELVQLDTEMGGIIEAAQGNKSPSSNSKSHPEKG